MTKKDLMDCYAAFIDSQGVLWEIPCYSITIIKPGSQTSIEISYKI